MPRDMAMKRPHTRIISIKLYHEIPRLCCCPGLKELRVSSLGVDVVYGAVPFAGAFRYNPEVMAVEMHGMGDGDINIVV